MTVKLSSTLPGDHGLNAALGSFIDTPESPHIIVAVVGTKTLSTSVDDGDVVPTIRIQRVEVVDGAEGEQVLAILARRTEQRTSREPLPLNIDPLTGEAADD